MSDDSVSFNIEKETFMEILKRAASQERTVMEFRTRETENGRELDTVMDITEHVKALEE